VKAVALTMQYGGGRNPGDESVTDSRSLTSTQTECTSAPVPRSAAAASRSFPVSMSARTTVMPSAAARAATA
jgi:hypothetical protein